MNTPTSDPWTVLVYFAGDNNLSTDMSRALEDVIQSGHNENINIYAYFDSLSRDVPTMYCDLNGKDEQEDGRVLRRASFFRSHKIRPKLIERGRLYNENSASMNNILNFVDWCVMSCATRIRLITARYTKNYHRPRGILFIGAP